MKKILIMIVLLILVVTTGCQQVDQQVDMQESAVSEDSDNNSADENRLKVLATTTIVGDVVAQVGGDAIDLEILLPVGADPHGFKPTPQDVAKMTDADVIFANGLGFEEFLEPMIANSLSADNVFELSDGIVVIEGEEHHDEHEGEKHHDEHEGEEHHDEHEGEKHHDEDEGEEHHDEHEGEEHHDKDEGEEHHDEDEGEEHHDEHEGEEHHDEDEGEEHHDEHEGEKHHDEDEGEEHHDEHEGHAHDHGGIDPHAWFNPLNVVVWTNNVADVLSEKDSANSQIFVENAEAYVAELESLDLWISEQVAQVPNENRKLITDHEVFGYFAERYMFTQMGTLLPSYSTASEPTAKDIAEIEDIITDFDVQAMFVGNMVNPDLAERVAADTGAEIVFVYTGSLSESSGEASTYLDYMKYNTKVIVDALK